ncbi:hypothetical protein IBTHAUMO2_780027 [Nitrosopumilaceae archaeon]|nr:hypothetical protein [Nitrosopumilus sp.]CAI9832456.1 hypothetical protein IBTHAUMO2_780027 [Nitrosopumilaceae archaeon]
MFPRRHQVLELVEKIRDAGEIRDLGNMVSCKSDDSIWFLTDNVCRLYFEHLEGKTRPPSSNSTLLSGRRHSCGGPT